MTIHERLVALRLIMQQKKIDYYFISNSDAHQNEYLPPFWQRYEYVSGFSGSNAEILIGLKEAYLWTDGRYEEQAKIEVAADLFQVFTYTQGAESTVNHFIAHNLKNFKMAVDPQTITIHQASLLDSTIAKNDGELIFLDENLIDSIWRDRPPVTHEKFFYLPQSYTGQDADKKIMQLRQFLREEQQEAIIISDLISIAWLFNLRGKDLLYTPVGLAYALITLTHSILFVQPEAFTQKTLDYLKEIHTTTYPYKDFYQLIGKLCPKHVILEEKNTNQAIFIALKNHIILASNAPIALWKACKNNTEINGAKIAHQLDAIALIRFFTWLEKNKIGQSEMSIAEKLLHLRKMAKTCKGMSFTTIAGYGEHGAIIHYHALPETDVAIGQNALLLLDSGGQYLEGTTDVTRTLHLGDPSQFEKHCYTLVLKGHLALKRAIFPSRTRGEQLDVLARQYLWQEGFNYAHGTGHGVGAFLGVHEGPQRISTAVTSAHLELNMIVSNEPGIYLPGKFGIRIENLMYVKPADTQNYGAGDFYTFEDLTLVPYARNLIEKSLLTEVEIAQINTYHNHILQALSPLLDVECLKWLIDAAQDL